MTHSVEGWSFPFMGFHVLRHHCTIPSSQSCKGCRVNGGVCMLTTFAENNYIRLFRLLFLADSGGKEQLQGDGLLG